MLQNDLQNLMWLSSCRNDSLWVTSSNMQSCLNETMNEKLCPKSSPFECRCLAMDCGVLYDVQEPACLGTDKWVTSKGYLSVQSVRAPTRTVCSVQYSKSHKRCTKKS